MGRNNLKGHLVYKWPAHEAIYTNIAELTNFPNKQVKNVWCFIKE